MPSASVNALRSLLEKAGYPRLKCLASPLRPEQARSVCPLSPNRDDACALTTMESAGRAVGWRRHHRPRLSNSEQAALSQKIKDVVIQSDIKPPLRHIRSRVSGCLGGKHENAERLVDRNLGRKEEPLPATIPV